MPVSLLFAATLITSSAAESAELRSVVFDDVAVTVPADWYVVTLDAKPYPVLVPPLDRRRTDMPYFWAARIDLFSAARGGDTQMIMFRALARDRPGTLAVFPAVGEPLERRGDAYHFRMVTADGWALAVYLIEGPGGDLYAVTGACLSGEAAQNRERFDRVGATLRGVAK